MKKNNTLLPVPLVEPLTLTPTPLPFKGSTLHLYIRSVNQYPTLSLEEERNLLLKFHETKEWRVAEKVILANLKFVVFIAKNFAGYQLNQADLIQEGNIGLMKAVQHYDPGFKVRLMAFAVHWIKAEIYEYILNNWKIVKIANNKHQRKLFFNLRKFFQQDLASPPALEHIAHELDVPLHEVQQMQARLFAGADLSLELLTQSSFEQSSGAASNPVRERALIDKGSDFSNQLANFQEEQALKQAMHSALKKLDDRARDIIYSRWLKEPKETLQVLATRHGISFERVRQLEKKALDQFRQLLLPAPQSLPTLAPIKGIKAIADHHQTERS